MLIPQPTLKAACLPCDTPNFLITAPIPTPTHFGFMSVAGRLIENGEEITCDYGAFCVGWTGFD